MSLADHVPAQILRIRRQEQALVKHDRAIVEADRLRRQLIGLADSARDHANELGRLIDVAIVARGALERSIQIARGARPEELPE